MNKERLLKVVSALENAPVDTFHISAWGAKRNGCKSVFCAVGHYVKANPDSRLHLTWFDFEATLFGDGDCNFEAAATEFGLTKEGALWLFSGASYPLGIKTRKCDVIARIRAFVGVA